jgi:uncharacterized protein (TIGR03435 family)
MGLQGLTCMRGFVLFLAACAFGHAQTPIYDVVSIKPSQGGGRPGPQTGPGGRFTATNTTLKSLMVFAWDVHSYEIVGGPGWLDSAVWDIVATPEHPVEPGLANIEHFRTMLRSLLIDRFQLEVHREQKELPVYALVIAKGGLKLTPGEAAAHANEMRLHMSNGQMIAQKITWKFVAQMFSEFLGRTVVDQTGSDDAFDFKLQWTPDPTQSALPLDPGQTPPDPSGPSLFTAVQEQLGLRLEAQKAPVEILVVDRAVKASEN